MKIGGGTAGHNGLRSIDAHIGPEFRRVRIGIGHPGPQGPGHRRTCSAITPRPRSSRSSDLLGAIAAEADWLADGDDARFMSDVALRLQQSE